MSVDIRSSDRRRYMNEIQAREKEIAAGLLKAGQPESPKLPESDKRHRREIANSNERRRMQCINAGFSNLRALIPQLEGEKLSKASILQHTTEYITSLEKEKRQLQLQVDHFTRLLADVGTQGQQGTDGFVACTPPPSKRKKRITESSDEGVGALSDESDDGGQVSEQLRQENLNLNHQLDSERQQRQAIEERNQMLERQLFAMLQSQQSAQAHTLEELGPVKLESHSTPVHESLYNREVVEVIGSMRGMPTPPREDTTGQHYSHIPPRPMSPTPERGMTMDSSSSLSVVTEVSITPQPQALVDSRPASVHYNSAPLLRASLAGKGDNLPYAEETSALGVTFQHVSSSSEPETRVGIPEASPLHDEDQPMRTYQHRDHPRRRHRQQARLERQRAQQEEEEKLRRRELEKEQQYQERVLAPPLPPGPQPQAFRPTQNLENLVEAIRHIEGEAALCDPGRLCDEETKLFEKRQVTTNSSEEYSSMSDPDELKSESSGRDSPIQHHTYHQHHLHHLQLNNTASSSPSLSSLSISSAQSDSATPVTVVSGSLSDYQSHGAFLVHPSSSHPSPFYRPGVIVPKQ